MKVFVLVVMICSRVSLASVSQPPKPTCMSEYGMYETAAVAWKDLSEKMRAAAQGAGYTRLLWEGPSACEHCFSDLSVSQKRAVRKMDSDAECWDKFITVVFGKTCSSDGNLPEGGERPPGVHCKTDDGIYNNSVLFSARWKDVPARQREGLETCGYTQALWDWQGPPGSHACFADLSDSLREAFVNIVSDAECWDQQFQSKGVNCTQLMREVKSATKRQSIYDGITNQFEVRSKGLLAKGAAVFSRRIMRGDLPLNNLLLLAPLPLSLITYVFVTRRFWPSCLLSPLDTGYARVPRDDLDVPVALA